MQVHDAFAAGCEAYRAAGFGFGDPLEWLHPPDHPHRLRPDFHHCTSCSPPVQALPPALSLSPGWPWPQP